MDRFSNRFTARGPTLAADRETWTGSLHIVDLPSAEAAQHFVSEEPFNRAGLFEHHLIRRFDNRLGRTMWEGPTVNVEDPLFLVIAQSPSEEAGNASAPGGLAINGWDRERLIVHGDLLTPEEGVHVGVVLAVQSPTREEVDRLLVRELDRQGNFDAQILDWELGGRR